MARYAQLRDGRVVELIETDLDISTLYHPSLIWTQYDGRTNVAEGWDAAQDDDGQWVLSPHIEPPPAADVILAENSAMRDGLLGIATLAIAPLQDAIDLGEATDNEVAMLKKWKQYRVAVNRMNLTILNPGWPSQP